METNVKRPIITQHVLGLIATKMDEQNYKGLLKYGHTIDEADFDVDGNEYDWNEMALEELLDCVQYLMKENMKLRKQLRESGKK